MQPNTQLQTTLGNDPGRYHQIKIAKQTLRMSDLGASIMGVSKPEARGILRNVAGWSISKIQSWEDK